MPQFPESPDQGALAILIVVGLVLAFLAMVFLAAHGYFYAVQGG